MTHSHMPAGAGPATPGNDNAPVQGRVEGQGTADSRHCADDGAAAQLKEALRKRRETLAAKLARRGYELRELDSGAWLISKWNLTREISGPGLEGVEAFAGQVGAV